MGAISGKVARIRHTSASATNSTNEASDLSTDGVSLSINSTAKRHWDRTSTAPAIFVSGATASDISADVESINYVKGIVTFTTPHSTSTTITMDVDYLTSSYLAGGRNWSVDVDSDMLDVTAFSTTATDVTWRTFVAGLNGAEVSIERLFQDSTANVFWDALAAGSSNFIVELVPDGAGGDRFEGFARVSQFSPSVEIDGTADEGVTLTVDGVLYFTTN